MAPSFDFTVSSLLCAEDNNSILVSVSLVERNHRDRNRNLAGDLGLLMESDESLALMVGKEFEHFPNLDYLNRLRMGHFDLNISNQALDWILKVASFSYTQFDSVLINSQFVGKR